jgi:ubiquinone/menaquinone biosynthesis C-methylase UbiE
MDKTRHDELNASKWDERSKTFDDRRFNYFRLMQKKLVSSLNLKEGQRLLDLGCGTGWAVRYAAGLVHERGEFYGIDISPKMIEKAEASSSGFNNVHFSITSAEQLPFDDNFFDFIICSNSFHHYFNPDKVLSEVYRVLKPGGRIYILDATSDTFIVRMADKRTKKRDPAHVKLYSTQEFGTLFARAKLSHVASKSIWGILFMKIHIGEKERPLN